jgi:hypothetical protein
MTKQADAVVYLSDRTHASIDRGLRLLGLHPRQPRRLSHAAGLRLDTRKLADCIRLKRQAALRPEDENAIPQRRSRRAIMDVHFPPRAGDTAVRLHLYA